MVPTRPSIDAVAVLIARNDRHLIKVWPTLTGSAHPDRSDRHLIKL